MSSEPKASRVSANSRSTSSSFDTSAPMAMRLATVGNDLPGQRFGGFGLAVVVDDHCRAGSGQGFGGRVADAGAGAGDQGDLSGERDVHAVARLE